MNREMRRLTLPINRAEQNETRETSAEVPNEVQTEAQAPAERNGSEIPNGSGLRLLAAEPLTPAAESGKMEPPPENTRLSDNDLDEYLKVGKRQHVRDLKAAQVAKGESPILTKAAEIRNFIRDSILGKIRNTVKGYGKVGTNLSNAVAEADRKINNTGEPLNISGMYLELESNHLAHMGEHIEEDPDGRNIPLTQEQAERIPEYLDSATDVLDVIRRKDGSVRLKIGSKINGYSVIIEWVSSGRNSLHPVTAWSMSTEDYESRYKNKKTLRLIHPMRRKAHKWI